MYSLNCDHFICKNYGEESYNKFSEHMICSACNGLVTHYFNSCLLFGYSTTAPIYFSSAFNIFVFFMSNRRDNSLPRLRLKLIWLGLIYYYQIYQILFVRYPFLTPWTFRKIGRNIVDRLLQCWILHPLMFRCCIVRCHLF